jgi:hypothetical protein
LNKQADSTGTVPRATGSIDEAAKALEGLLTSPEDNQEDDEAKPDAEAQDESEAEEQPGSEDEAQDEESGDESEENVEQDEEEDGQQPSAKKFTLTIEGKDVEVDEGELKNGYLRQSDYTRKTQALATERRTLTEQAEAVRQERAEYAQRLPKLRAALEAGMTADDSVDWDKLRTENPAEYAAKRADQHQRKLALQQLDAEQGRIAERQARDQQAQFEQMLIVERNTLLEKVPEWRDEKVREKDAAAIDALLEAAGYAEGDREVYDHRQIIILRKAAAYDALMATKGKLQERVKNVPVARPGAKQKTNPVSQRARDDRSRFAKTGDVRDAARVLEHLIK